jgi:arylsulfatase A-like enzyme
MRQPPNILLLTTDELRTDALGCYGKGVIQTPNVNDLARRGVRFGHMFAAYPVCAPNRASMVRGVAGGLSQEVQCHWGRPQGRRHVSASG